MSIKPYQRVLSIAQARQVLLLGFLLRIPIFSAGVVLTLHVVQSLGGSYSDAGIVSAVATIAIAVSGPWRGRLLDRLGLRRVVLPSLIISGLCWSIAPFVGYWALLGLAAVAGLFVVPTFSVVRQGVIAAVSPDDRRTALSLDGIFLEMSFMVGPLVSVWLCTMVPTRYVLFGIEMIGVLVGIVLWQVNPPIRPQGEVVESTSVQLPRSSWMHPMFLAVCAAAVGATVVLGGSDVAIVAAMRDFHQTSSLGIVLLLWSAGSVAGGLVYGAISRPVSPFLLLAGLAVTTIPMGFSANTWQLGLLGFLAGVFCAPTITSTVDAVSRVVPTSARGEAMGWHGSAMTAGSALGAPLGGFAIDQWQYTGGFVLVSLLGLAIAVAGATVAGRWRRAVADLRLAA